MDINSKDSDIAMFKANAIRALSKVIDPSMVTAVERFLKQAIVDREHNVASSAIVSAFHFWSDNRDNIKRWLAEIQQALNSASIKSITQYHALGLLYLIKQDDRMALTKLVQQIHKSSANPLTVYLFLRIYAQLLVSDPMTCVNPIDLKPYLRQSGPKGEIVGLEAARIICERSSDVYAADVEYTINALQVFLGSNKATVRFSALRILNDLASKCPQKVATCNQDIESLITHPNRNIATLAITALLKTGDENAVDRLIKQIGGYIGEISDEFKIIVVDAVRALCLKFPTKYEGMLDFLGNVLRDEGAFEYKQATVDAICETIEAIPAANEAALVHLCEFIEDSEYPTLTAQILYLLGTLGPKTKQPSKLIRYIYNRLVLEDAEVRVAAVGALTKFALEQPSLKPSIISILKRSLNDPDDDVRDRAIISLKGMESASPFLSGHKVPDLAELEQKLLEYTASKEFYSEPFSLAGLPLFSEQEVFREAKKARFDQLVPTAVASPNESPETMAASERQSSMLHTQISNVEEFLSYGPVFKSSTPIALTDSSAEYTVFVRKHLFVSNKLVLEFIVTNTVPSVLLGNVSVICASSLHQIASVPISSLVHNQSGSCYLAFDLGQCTDETFECSLNFRSQECDPDTLAPLEDGYIDRYPIDGVEFGLGDHVKAREVYDFMADWESFSKEIIQTFALGSLSSIPEAIQALLDLYGLPATSGSALYDPRSPIHTLLLCGELNAHGKFAIRSRMAMSRVSSPGVSLELAVRADDDSTTAAIIEALG